MQIKHIFKITFFALVLGFGFSKCTSILGNTSVDTDTAFVLSKEDRLRKDIVDYSKKQLGTKYVYAGRDTRGFDCSGFTYYVMRNFDVKLSTNSRAQAKEGAKVDLKKAKEGDLIFFKRSKAGKVFHVAMVVSNKKDGLTVIHSTSRGVVVDNISKSKYWKPKIWTARSVLK